LVNKEYAVFNLGESKGMTFERVIIFPTQAMCAWLINHDSELKNYARARLYVGVARYSFKIQ